MDDPRGRWWVGTSLRNGDYGGIECAWSDWVKLAQKILADDEKWRSLTHEARAAIEAEMEPR